MSSFAWSGIAVRVPSGWEARGGGRGPVPTNAAVRVLERPYVHVANFPMTAPRAPYGSGVVESMGPEDVFAAIIEFLPESAHTPLFRDHGPPRRLRAADFSPSCLQRTLRGQLGVQRFFSASGRALCLYVVMGGVPALRHALPTLNVVLGETTVHRVPEVA